MPVWDCVACGRLNMMQLSHCANCTCLRPHGSPVASFSASPPRQTATSYSPIREYRNAHSPQREDVLEREALLRELRIKDMEIRRLKEQLSAQPKPSPSRSSSPPPSPPPVECSPPTSSVECGVQTMDLATSCQAAQTDVDTDTVAGSIVEAPPTVDVVALRKELDTLRSRDQMKSRYHAALEVAHRELKQHTMVLEKATTDMEGPLGSALDLLSKRFVQA